MEYNEEEVLLRASQGDRDAFGQLYERYVERIFNYVYYRTGMFMMQRSYCACFQRAMNHIKTIRSRRSILPGYTASPTTWWRTGTVTEAASRKSRWMTCPSSDQGDHPKKTGSLTGQDAFADYPHAAA